jgi:hypothetical protein
MKLPKKDYEKLLKADHDIEDIRALTKQFEENLLEIARLEEYNCEIKEDIDNILEDVE